jgi:anaerobic magnesium-protoporphyrin IX monomethyl ester cyclase
MKILLINAPVINILEPWYDEPNFVRTSIAFLAGYIRKYSDYEVECIDAKFEKLDFNQVLERVIKKQPDVIGFTAFTNEVKPSAYQAALIKKHLPHIITVMGGAHLTALPIQTLKEFPSVDIGIFGEGEETLLELCNALSNNTPLAGIKGVTYRDDSGNILKNDERPRILDQDQIPIPAWDLLPPAEMYYIQTIRGCPFNCVFCMNHNGKVARKRSLNLVIDEMKYLIERGAKHISFGDELFSVDMERTHKLLDLMIEHKIGDLVKWDIQTHVAYVDNQLLAKMKRAKIYRCEMGVESGDEKALKRMGKATNEKMIVQAFNLARKHEITVGSFLLFGQPNETIRSMWKTIKLGIKINPHEPMIGTMVPYPGTEVSKMAANGEGGYKLVSYNWDEYGKQINGSLEFTNLSLRKIKMMQMLGYTLIFIANFRFLDFFKFFWNYRVAAVNLFTDTFFNKKQAKSLKPDDYELLLNSKQQITFAEMLEARSYWKKVQSNEMIRTKKEMPQLMKEQMLFQNKLPKTS